MITLHTPITKLRPFKESDINDLNEYCMQDGVGEMAGWRHHNSLNESIKTLKSNISNPNIFAIEYTRESKVIGYITVNNDSENNRNDTKELSFALNRNYQNQGIMREVIFVVLEYLFSSDIEYIYACCFQENLQSKSLIEKCGFEFEKQGSYYSNSLDKTFTTFEYIYTKHAWDKKR
ncbi:MAG: family N-acetyltransferase [Herbinix sp.]|jgi:ribosomal-protein-alanine N-acetyltransferase|nr:family N-acetyltransferase [Herbinix sp.]